MDAIDATRASIQEFVGSQPDAGQSDSNKPVDGQGQSEPMITFEGKQIPVSEVKKWQSEHMMEKDYRIKTSEIARVSERLAAKEAEVAKKEQDIARALQRNPDMVRFFDENYVPPKPKEENPFPDDPYMGKIWEVDKRNERLEKTVNQFLEWGRGAETWRQNFEQTQAVKAEENRVESEIKRLMEPYESTLTERARKIVESKAIQKALEEKISIDKAVKSAYAEHDRLIQDEIAYRSKKRGGIKEANIESLGGNLGGIGIGNKPREFKTLEEATKHAGAYLESIGYFEQ